MRLNNLQNTPGATHKPSRVGCGDGSGKGGTSGRGHKGQYARSGHKHKPGFEGGQMRLLRRIPKRGFNNAAFSNKCAELNLKQLAKFHDNQDVTPDVLYSSGLLKNKTLPVKILGNGDLNVKLKVSAHSFSKGAKEKIEKAGGSCVVLS
jgi:large subunit ribosomal protein L15